ncbi:unnamed protein product [Hapterophycus canaliculatus]
MGAALCRPRRFLFLIPFGEVFRWGFPDGSGRLGALLAYASGCGPPTSRLVCDELVSCASHRLCARSVGFVLLQVNQLRERELVAVGSCSSNEARKFLVDVPTAFAERTVMRLSSAIEVRPRPISGSQSVW